MPDFKAGKDGNFIFFEYVIHNQIDFIKLSAIFKGSGYRTIYDILVEEKTELSMSATDLINNVHKAIKFIRESII